MGQHVFVRVLRQTESEQEEEGLMKLFSMMLYIKQQKVLRRKLGNRI